MSSKRSSLMLFLEGKTIFKIHFLYCTKGITKLIIFPADLISHLTKSKFQIVLDEFR